MTRAAPGAVPASQTANTAPDGIGEHGQPAGGRRVERLHQHRARRRPRAGGGVVGARSPRRGCSRPAAGRRRRRPARCRPRPRHGRPRGRRSTRREGRPASARGRRTPSRRCRRRSASRPRGRRSACPRSTARRAGSGHGGSSAACSLVLVVTPPPGVAARSADRSGGDSLVAYLLELEIIALGRKLQVRNLFMSREAKLRRLVRHRPGARPRRRALGAAGRARADARPQAVHRPARRGCRTWAPTSSPSGCVSSSRPAWCAGPQAAAAGGASVYELTEWGVRARARAAGAGALGQPRAAARPARRRSASTLRWWRSRRCSIPPPPAGSSAEYELALGEQRVHAAGGRRHGSRSRAASRGGITPALVIETDPGTLAAVLWHGAPLERAGAVGRRRALAFTGGRRRRPPPASWACSPPARCPARSSSRRAG